MNRTTRYFFSKKLRKITERRNDGINEVLLEYQAQFPFLNQLIDKPIVYLDSAATTQKPKCVIDALNQHLLNFTANVHRGGHRLGREATAQFEAARIAVQGFIKLLLFMLLPLIANNFAMVKPFFAFKHVLHFYLIGELED